MSKIPEFIAEVSSNHHRDIDRCRVFIDTAAEIGCHAVKFQLFKIDQLFAPEILRKSKMHRERKEWELPEEYVPLLAEHCHSRNIQFCCTPFYLEAVKVLEPYVDSFKIASYELLWGELLNACATTGLPLILSTGMATLDEVTSSVELLQRAGCNDLTLLHCVSGYPTPVNECNLAALQTLRQAFSYRTGWSDHSVNPAVIARAVHHWNAEVIEFHLDLDGQGAEFSSGHCWLPEQIGGVIETCRYLTEADGDGIKRPVPSELPDRPWRADPADGLRPFRRIREEWR